MVRVTLLVFQTDLESMATSLRADASQGWPERITKEKTMRFWEQKMQWLSNRSNLASSAR